jgi:hypothetical protein
MMASASDPVRGVVDSRVKRIRLRDGLSCVNNEVRVLYLDGVSVRELGQLVDDTDKRFPK